NCSRCRMIRMSQYEALSRLASFSAAAPSASRSGLGVVASAGAANNRLANAAAVVFRKVRLVNILLLAGKLLSMTLTHECRKCQQSGVICFKKRAVPLYDLEKDVLADSGRPF